MPREPSTTKTYVLGPGNVGGGSILVPGCKNRFTNLSALAWLAEGGMTFRRVPDVTDAHSVLHTFRTANAKVRSIGPSAVRIDVSSAVSGTVGGGAPLFRTSICHAAALAATQGFVTTPLPGGDPLGGRPFDLHLRVMEAAGATIERDRETLSIKFGPSGPTPFGHPVSMRTQMGHPSIGASVTALIVASKAQGTSVMHNLSRSPIVSDCAHILRSLGASIELDSSGTCRVTGKRELSSKPIDVEVAPDVTAAATFMFAGIVRSDSPVQLRGIASTDFPREVLDYFSSAGVEVSSSSSNGNRGIEARRTTQGKPRHLRLCTDTETSDLAPLMFAHAALSEGGMSIVESVHNSRSSIAEAMTALGMKVHTTERPTTMEVFGAQAPRALAGTTLRAADIRYAGALMILAAGLQGETIRLEDPYDHVGRGYENVQANMAEVGVSVVDTTRRFCQEKHDTGIGIGTNFA